MRTRVAGCTLSCVLLAAAASPGIAAEPVRQLWSGDCLAKVMRSAAVPEKPAERLLVTGARGEIASGQAVYRSDADTAAATVRVTDLKSGDGAIIPAAAVRLQWARYIDIKRNTEGVPLDELVAAAPTSIPDPFWETPAVRIAAGTAQPCWVEVHIPPKAPPGDYDGTLTVTADGTGAELPLRVRVWDFDLPSERHLSVVNWWQFPGPGFEGRGEDRELLKRFCSFLSEHRQTDVNIGIWLISESGDAQKGFTHDTGRLERFCETAFEAGIRQIHLHSVGRRTADILDPQCQVLPDEGAFRRLVAWEKVIQKRGWQRRFVVSIVDEPFPYYEESYAAVVNQVHKAAPSVRCLEAVEAEHLGKLDIYVPKLSHLSLWYPTFDQARRNGAELWYYVCCHPLGRYPNRFLDQPLLKARVLFWISYLYNLDGYLHWGLNHYGGDPYTEDGVSKDLPLGDRAVVYPGKEGPIGSLRFSAQRDGLQDYEYLRLLESELRALKERAGAEAVWLDPRQRSLELCRRVVQTFHEYTRDPNVLLETRRAIAEEIVGVRREPLLVVQTSPPEGTVVPAGPRTIIVRGLAPPGAAVTVNGQALKNVTPGGYFRHVHFMPDGQPTITVTIEHNGRKRTAERTFRLSD